MGVKWGRAKRKKKKRGVKKKGKRKFSKRIHVLLTQKMKSRIFVFKEDGKKNFIPT